MRRLIAVALGFGAVAAVVALAFGALGLHLARATRQKGTGPTASTLDDAFWAWSSALVGLFLVAVAASIYVWPNRSIVIATATAVLGYGMAWSLEGLLADSGETAWEVISGGLFFAPVAAAAGLAAGGMGATAGRLAAHKRGSLRRPKDLPSDSVRS